MLATTALVVWGILNLPLQPALTHQVDRDSQGFIAAEYDLDANGKIHGTMTEYHPSGEVRAISEWDHGIAVGASRHFDESGIPEPDTID